MKLNRSHRGGHILGGAAVCLLAVVAAIGMTAANTSRLSFWTRTGQLVNGDLGARNLASTFKRPHFAGLDRDFFETSLGKLSQSGEPASVRVHNGRAQEAYDDRAYPRKWIGAAQQRNAALAAAAVASLAPATATS